MSEMTFQQTRDLFTEAGHRLVTMGAGAAQVAVCPALAGRIVAATLAGPEGFNPFFVNPVDVTGGPGSDKLIFRGALGGRDWLGPEGCGDMSFYFKQSPYTFENWYVDARQSLMPTTVERADDGEIVTAGAMHLPNVRGNQFDIGVRQRMTLVTDCQEALGAALPPDVAYVGFNRGVTFTNTGSTTWSDSYGYCLIWFLLMLRSSDNMFIIAPFLDGAGPEVIDYEFDGPLPGDRLLVRPERRYVVFKADGRARGKIGQVPARAAGIVYALDLDRGWLSVLRYDVDRHADYLDNRWTAKAHPTGGDVMDAYNNLAANAALPGRFCELEAVSPRLALAPGAAATLKTTTGFFRGPRPALERIIKATSGADLSGETFTL